MIMYTILPILLYSLYAKMNQKYYLNMTSLHCFEAVSSVHFF